MKLWNINRYIRILVILVLFGFFSALILVSSDHYIQPNFKIYALEDNWEITMNGVTLDSTSLRECDLGIVGSGDKITISKVIPDLGIDNPCISVYSIHAMMYAYLDNELIYSFGSDYLKAQKTVPKHYNYFPLGYDYAGKKLTIILSGSRRNSFSGLSPVFAGERSDLLTAYLISMRYNILAGTFLIMLGIVLMILSPYMVIYHHNDLRLFFSGLISLLLGLYTYSFYCLIDLICNNANINTICEYSALYNIPTAILGYLMSVYKGKLKKLFTALFWINIAVFLTVFICCVIGRSRLFEFTPLLHGMSASESTLSIIVLIRDFVIKKKKKGRTITSDNVFAAGLIIFMVLSLIDISRYNFKKYVGQSDEAYSTINGFLIGALIFVSGLLISYLLYIIYTANLDSMQNKIASLAYTDPLTGLANRARCEQVMDVLTQEHATYTIISLDLNKLKQVNDSLGHHEGDRLLSGFATILSDCFLDANLVGRMGGDEFMVILTEERSLNTTKRIHEFYSLMNDWNHKEMHFQYSASYGYAYSYEVPSGSAQEVYMLADSRMYEMKKEHQNDKTMEVIKNA